MKDVQKALEHGMKYFENQEKYLLDERIHDANLINTARENIKLYETALAEFEKYRWHKIDEKPIESTEDNLILLILSKKDNKTGKRTSSPGYFVNGKFTNALCMELIVNDSYRWSYAQQYNEVK